MAAVDRPSGTVTFLFTDVEGSTRLWEAAPDATREALERHDAILRSAVERSNGYVFATGGDGFAVAFTRADDAVGVAIDAQTALALEPWPAAARIRVRMGVHTGEAAERDGNYFGPAVNRAARLMAVSHGGQVVVSGATRDVLGAKIELRDLGEHRLRDLARPERVFQVVIAGVDDDFPRLRSLETLPTNLPIQLTTFIGREEELKHIADLAGDHRLVTVTGVGGVGKTRVALQVAADMLPVFPDGVWFCELASAEDEAALADVTAYALRAPARPGMSLLDSVVEFLRTKELLLLIDNCEHLLTEVGSIVERILQTCPRVRVVATSREGLGVPGEHLWPLRSLATPRPTDSPEVVRLTDAVRLFVDRANAVDPNFALETDGVEAVGEICRRLDGIPLAIELAAARVSALSPAEIASHLDERFRLLTGGRRRSVERHHTLRATVDWSYSLLNEQDRSVFDRLSVFAGSFDAAAAQAVASDGGIETFDVLDALSELVAKSMLDAEQAPGGTRYQLLETLRQYALEQLAGRGETDAFRRRHAEYYAAFAGRVGPLLLGREELSWRPRLRLELDNLRAAVAWALDRDTDEDPDVALQILAALWQEAVLDRGSGIGGWAERAVEVIKDSPSDLRATVVATAGFGAFHRGDLARAEALARDAFEATRETDDATAAWAAMLLSNATLSTGQLEKALAILDDAASWVPETNSYTHSAVHAVLAINRRLVGDSDGAREAAAIALDIASASGQPSALALALYATGMALLNVDAARAREACERSLALAETGAGDVVYGNTLAMLAILAEREGDQPEATSLVRRSIFHGDAIGDRPPIVGGLHTAGRTLAGVAAPEAIAVIAGGLYDGWYQGMTGTVPERDRLTGAPLAAAEAVLGEDRFRTAWERGAVMSYEELVAFTLAELDEALSQFDYRSR
jgi:predicted ATPase/class 3 adenylate cyclase